MSLGNGRHYLAIPGPSVMPDRVLQAMHRASPNIYDGELIDMVPGIMRDLKDVARTVHNVAIYVSNGHGVWEASLANTMSRGETVLVLDTGSFSLGWAEIAEMLGINCRVISFGNRNTVDIERLIDALTDDPDHQLKAVLMTHVDTSTSVRNDVKAVRAAMDKVNHPALLMVDCIASFACEEFEMDAWGVDLALAVSQKGLMTPPGMGFVFFSDKAAQARASANCVTHYWDWNPRIEPRWFSEQFDGTAPTHHLYGLREALDMIEEEGLEAVWHRHSLLARAIWAAFDVWSQQGSLELNIPDPAMRSNAVTALRAGSSKASDLRNWLEDNAGVTLGIGLGMADINDPTWHHYFRIGHMGHVNAHMVLGTLAAIEAGMKAVGIEYQAGGVVAAAEIISAT